MNTVNIGHVASLRPKQIFDPKSDISVDISMDFHRTDQENVSDVT